MFLLLNYKKEYVILFLVNKIVGNCSRNSDPGVVKAKGLLKAIFGLMENGGVRWKGIELLKILLFGYKINGWNGMGEDGMDSIQFHYINSFNFLPILGGGNGMESLLIMSFYSILFHFIPLLTINSNI